MLEHIQTCEALSKKMHFGWVFFGSTAGEATRKVRVAIQRAIINLKHNGIRSLLNYSFYEIMPTTKNQLAFLPELELQIGDDTMVKHKLTLHTHTQPELSVHKSHFSSDRIARQIERFLDIVKMEQDGGFRNHISRT